MFTGYNEGDWVALYDGESGKFQKVARIEHKFILTGKEAKTYQKNFLEVLMIRHQDKSIKSFESDGTFKTNYLIIDAATGLELNHHHHHIVVGKIPCFKNIINEQTGQSWDEMIERQKLVYMLSDIDWKTTPTTDLEKISRIIFERQLKGNTNEN